METDPKVEEKVEEVLDYLLDLAIDRFGYAARDVFEAISDFDSATIRSQEAFNINFQQLEKYRSISRCCQYRINGGDRDDPMRVLSKDRRDLPRLFS